MPETTVNVIKKQNIVHVAPTFQLDVHKHVKVGRMTHVHWNQQPDCPEIIGADDHSIFFIWHLRSVVYPSYLWMFSSTTCGLRRHILLLLAMYKWHEHSVACCTVPSSVHRSALARAARVCSLLLAVLISLVSVQRMWTEYRISHIRTHTQTNPDVEIININCVYNICLKANVTKMVASWSLTCWRTDRLFLILPKKPESELLPWISDAGAIRVRVFCYSDFTAASVLFEIKPRQGNGEYWYR